jgi:hypothetical protein
MNGSIDYRLGQIDQRLEAIEKRLGDGSERHKDLDDRLDKLELVEAKRGGVIAAIAARAGIGGAVLTLVVPPLLKKR